MGSSSRGFLSVVRAKQTASDEIEMLQKMLELAKQRKENESKEDLSVSAGGKSNGSGYEGTIKRRILEAIFESNRSFLYRGLFSRRRVSLIADRFLRDSIPKDDLKSVLETRVALFCYGSSVIDDDVEHFSLSLSRSLVLLSVSARTTVKRRMTNFSSFSFFLMKLRRVV